MREFSEPGPEDRDEETERGIQELRQFLVREEEVPFGLVAWLEAGVRRAGQRTPRLSWEARAVVASLLFIMAGTADPSGLAVPWVMLVTALIAGLYALAIELGGQPQEGPRA